jgi:hypothetical protein
MERTEFNERLGEIYKEIKDIEIDKHTMIETLYDDFFAIMRKWGIPEGVWSMGGGGRICNNFEWSFCCDAFIAHVSSGFELCLLFGKIEVPDDLKAYGEEPKKKSERKKK